MLGLWVMALGMLLCAAEVSPEEAALCRRASERPGSFAANRSLAGYYLRQNRISAALPWLEKAEVLDPANYDNDYDLALARLQTKNPEGARKLLQEMSSRQDRAELHNLMGDVEETEGHIQKAAEEYEAAARMDPSEKNLFDLGSDLTLHGGFEPALKVFVFGVQRYPRSARLRVGLGTVYYSIGQYDEAVETLCQAVDLDPKDTKALDFLGKMYNVSPRYASEVAKRLARFVEIYPDNAAANYYYALSLRKRARPPESSGSDAEVEKLLLRAVKLNPEYAEARFELGLLYEDEGRDARAIQEYRTAIHLGGPDLPKAHYRLAQLYKKNGQPALAEKEFNAFEALKQR